MLNGSIGTLRELCSKCYRYRWQSRFRCFRFNALLFPSFIKIFNEHFNFGMRCVVSRILIYHH
jgi:hypothetical protein